MLSRLSKRLMTRNTITTVSITEYRVGEAPEVTSVQTDAKRSIQEPNQIQRVECQLQKLTMDTRLVVLAPDSDPAHSPRKVSEEAESSLGDQMTPDRHQEVEVNEEEEPVPSSANQPMNEAENNLGGYQQEENILSQILAPELMVLPSDNKRPFLELIGGKRRKKDLR